MQSDRVHQNIFENGVVTPKVYFIPAGTVAVEYTATGAKFTGNVGIGVTPSAWGASSYAALELGAVGQAVIGHKSVIATGLVDNAYNNGTDWKYAQTATAEFYQQYAGYHSFYNAASGTAGNTITWTQTLSFGKGSSLALEGATVQTGTGITFPATPNLSSDANTLDHYEEGTWTPTFTAGTSGSGWTYTQQSANYVKIGKQVTVWGLIECNNKGTALGLIFLANLPFTPTATGSDVRAGGMFEYVGNVTPTALRLYAIGEGNSAAYIVYNNANVLTWADCTATFTMYFTYTFMTDDA